MFLQQGPAPTQTQRANPRQVENRAGGFVYEVDKWQRYDRFLMIGTQGGTYYADQKELTDENTANVLACIAEDGVRAVQRAVEISRAGRAVKQDYGLYAVALALADKNPATRSEAYLAIPKIARTGSTLFQIVSYHKGRGGWPRGLRNAIARWYNERSVNDAAFQMVKYQGRYGFTHRDVLRLAHVKPGNDGAGMLYRWAVGKDTPSLEPLPQIVRDFELAKGAPEEMRKGYAKVLPREALPTEWLNDPNVWEALLYGDDGRGMPITALVRNLGNLSKCGLLTASSDAARYVCGELMNDTRLRQGRVHPMAVYLGMKVYSLGHGLKGSGSWAPVGAVVDALDSAFYRAFGNVEATGKELLLAVDSSGSMQSAVAGLPVSAREAAMAMAMVTMRTEPKARLIGFTDGTNTAEFKVAGDERLRDLMYRFERTVEGRGTDCSIPMTAAEKMGMAPDAIIEFTDSETWAGRHHPDNRLDALRRSVGKPVKLAVAALTATAHTIGDPQDPNVLQCAGIDANLPAVLSAFLSEGQ